MPEFQIDGDAEIFENVDDIDIGGDIERYSFVTAHKAEGQDSMVLLTPVHPTDLSTFEGLLFQVDIDEEEDTIVLTQVQMFFWPWEDDEEFDEADSPDDQPDRS